jgi:hypothetical protein
MSGLCELMATGNLKTSIHRNQHSSPHAWAIPGTNAHSAWNNGDMRGWFHFGFGDPRRIRPANVQGIPEKAADGIRTHDLLHGKRST